MAQSAEDVKQCNIQPINKDVVHQICSGQVVLNLATAVKELVENSLDAGATVIEIRLKEYGSELIEVIDNGNGVEEQNFPGLTLKHHTSKLREFSDLVSVETFGFRGEALSSLCALSEMAIITRHTSASCGTRLEFDYKGQIIKKKPYARQVGTTVTLHNIFSSLPVRQKEFHRNLKREFAKMTQILYAYCLVSTGTKIMCSNQNKKGGRTVVVSTQGSETVRENIACVFGSKQVQSLMDFQQKPPNEALLQEYGIPVELISAEVPFHLEGCISTCAHGQGRSAADRQFFYVNSRPCEPTKVVKVVNEVYHQYNQHQYPFVFLNLKMARNSVDVNVTPDKRQVFLDQEKLLIAIIKASLLELYESIPSTFNFQNLPPAKIPIYTPDLNTQSSSPLTPAASLAERFKKWSHAASPNSSPSTMGKGTKRVSDFCRKENDRKSKLHCIDRFFSPTRKKENMVVRTEEPVQDSCDVEIIMNHSAEFMKCENNDASDIEIISDTVLTVTEESSTDAKNSFLEQNTVICEVISKSDNGIVQVKEESTIVEEDSITVVLSPEKNSNHQENGDKEIVKIKEHSIVITENVASRVSCPDVDPVDEHDMEQSCENVGDSRDTENNIEEADFSNTDITLNESLCENRIAEQLEECEVINESVHLVVIKTDEEINDIGRKIVEVAISISSIQKKLEDRRKRNLKKTKNQPLVKFRANINPNSNKSAEQELSKEISKDMFAKMEIIGQFNLGFIVTRLDTDLFIIDQHATDEKYNFEMLQMNTVLQNQRLVIPQKLDLTAVNESILMESIDVFRKNGFDFNIDEEAEPTKRVQLTAVPFSKNWEFGKEDIDELLFMLQDSPNTMCRPSRVRAMFASRACRKSVMIGTALSKANMRKLVDHMGEIEQPWNCPHGRPTMRHLVNLRLLHNE